MFKLYRPEPICLENTVYQETYLVIAVGPELKAFVCASNSKNSSCSSDQSLLFSESEMKY